MNPRRRDSRVYARTRRGVTRYYADFRDYADVGGKQMALVPEDQTRATTDPDVAAVLAAEELKRLKAKRSLKDTTGIKESAGLEAYAAHHLVEKARAGRTTERWLELAEGHLRAAIEFFGADRDLRSITVTDVQAWANQLARKPGRRARTVSGATVRKYLNSLSNLYRRAQGEEYVPPGYNPVAAVMDKPTSSRRPPTWFEVPEVALLLEAAR
ncbi:MAG TPA: hypothetical protein VML95_07370, partial [Longimicrobiales bacterium]|nr:hypothetical protein [Longimicrobiales bacterium]